MSGQLNFTFSDVGRSVVHDNLMMMMMENSTSFELPNHTTHDASGVCSQTDGRKVSVAEGLACIISILTVIENFVILTAITRGPRSLRKPPYWFIASLAAADLLTGVEVVLAIFLPVGTSPLSRIVLKGLAVVTFIVSINSLLLVSFDRYLRITHHMDYEKLLTRPKIIFLILMSWLVSFGLFLVAPLLGWSCASLHCCADDGLCACKRLDLCQGHCSQSFVPFTKSYILVGVVYFIISIIAMTAFYSALFKVVKKKTFGSRNNSTSDSKSKTGSVKFSSKREVQLTKTLIITLGIFVICWLPVMALFFADLIITNPTKQLAKVFDFALVPSVINSFLNPIIYSVRLPRMRVTIQRLLLPCIFGDQSRFLGATWATNTSYERSVRRKSVRKRIQKLKGGSDEGSSVGSSSRSGSGRKKKRSRIASNKSFNSEISMSRDSTVNSTPLPR